MRANNDSFYFQINLYHVRILSPLIAQILNECSFHSVRKRSGNCFSVVKDISVTSAPESTKNLTLRPFTLPST